MEKKALTLEELEEVSGGFLGFMIVIKKISDLILKSK